MSAWARISIVIVDCEGHVASIQTALLKAFGCAAVEIVKDPAQALTIVRNRGPDLLMLNWHKANEDWSAFVRDVRDEIVSPDPFLHIMLTTPYVSKRRVRAAIHMGVDSIITLPLSAHTLHGHLCRVVEMKRTFVRTGSYFGPDRRRRRTEVLFAERRGTGAGLATTLSAAEVDTWRRTQRDIARAQEDAGGSPVRATSGTAAA